VKARLVMVPDSGARTLNGSRHLALRHGAPEA